MDTDAGIKIKQDFIDQLNKEAWEYRVQDSVQSFKLSKDAVDLSEAINYVKGKAEGYRTLGFSYIRLSNHHQANELLERSLELFAEIENLQGQSDVYEFFGITKRSLGDYSASLDFLFRSLELRKQTGYAEGESLSLYHLGVTYKYLGDYERSLNYLLESLSIAQANNYWVAKSYALNLIGLVHYETGAFEKALEYYHQSLALRAEAGDKWGEAGCLDNIGFAYFKIKNFSQAINYCTRSLTISEAIGDKKGRSNSLFHLGNIYKELGNVGEAGKRANTSLEIRREIGDKKGEAEILLFLVDLQKQHVTDQEKDTLFQLLDRALKLGTEVNALDLLAKIHFTYYTIYKQYHAPAEALAQLELFIEVEKELHKDALNERIQNLEISHRAEQSKNEAEIYRLRNIELAKAFEESNRQKAEIELQKSIAEGSLADLKATQKQLIHSEKMASLGELTAGIAHEIQNPLNFINNFSEVNAELIDELEQEVDKGDISVLKAIAKDIKENEKKISHHGRRADAIVKGMLQHSRSSNGMKKPTDINKLVDEYLRLAYHGLRAKDKFFNATLNTSFDENISNIDIVPQDIGRVILNLINNAFYAVGEKKKSPQPLKGSEVYGPTVTITTKAVKLPSGDSGVTITVADNGEGIPPKVLNKIFQPFFTTKPTGQGTGLGLSLSYDIVKAHGGELKVETKEGEGTEFIIQLFINN